MKKFIQLYCTKCLHTWIRRKQKNPKVCPNCKRTQTIREAK